MRGVLDSLIAIAAGLLPIRWWGRFPTVQIERFAWLSGLLTMFAGFVLGIPGFLRYAGVLAKLGKPTPMGWLACWQDVCTDKVTPVAFSALAPVLFVLTTPLGLFSAYLVVSGIFRATAAYVDDPHGDPVLSLAVAAVTRATTNARARHRAAERERREGPEVADRLYPGEWAGLPQADYVVVSSRRKAGWEAGVFVITSDKWYRLGVPFDLELPAGVRTIYPLTALETVEVLRKGVAYELPPLSRGRGGAR